MRFGTIKGLGVLSSQRSRDRLEGGINGRKNIPLLRGVAERTEQVEKVMGCVVKFNNTPLTPLKRGT